MRVVADVYDPLLDLLRDRATAGTPPLLVGITGSVAVGKSTTAALLAERLAPIDVALVSTDGFLLPNAELEARGIMHRKGFPDSYDVARLVRFLDDLRSGAEVVEAPVYSHEAYDVLPGEVQVLRRPDLVLLDGVNVLATPEVAERLDLAVYVDASEEDIRTWYLDRFAVLRAPLFPLLGEAELLDVARSIWDEVNHRNLVDHILPTRDQADVVVRKGADHEVVEVLVRA